MVEGLDIISYQEQWKKLGMFVLKEKWWKADMVVIALCKYLNGCHGDDGANMFSAAPEGNAQTNGFRLQEKRFRLTLGRTS